MGRSDVTARVNKKITAELVNEMMKLIDADQSQEVTMQEFEEALAIEEVRLHMPSPQLMGVC